MYETPQVSAEIINTAFFNKLDSGMVKEAQEAAGAYIRQRLYEDGVLRRLFTPRVVTADELDPHTDSDKPSIIVEIEPDAPSATFVPYKGTGDRAYFSGKRFRVPFGKVEAERLNKSQFELMTIRMDIMTWLKENQVKQVQEQEDGLFMETVDDIITAAAGDQSTTAGVTDTFKDAFVLGLKGLTSFKLPVGRVLMHKNTYYESTKLRADMIGFEPVARRFEEGVEMETSFMGYPVVTTIKTEIVPEGVMYFFTPQDFFCKFFLLQDATLFLKKEADMIEFHTYEAPGFGVGNTRGVFKVTL
jgi:hypothetical protein